MTTRPQLITAALPCRYARSGLQNGNFASTGGRKKKGTELVDPFLALVFVACVFAPAGLDTVSYVTLSAQPNEG